MSFKNYLKFYFKKMPILTIILTAIVTKGGIIGAAFSSIIGFFLVLVFYMPVANTILSIFCYPIYAMFNKNSNIDTSKDNGFKYVLALSIIWFYSFLVGSFILGMLGVLAPDSTQELLNETNNIKESFTSIMGDDPTFWIFALFMFLTVVIGLPKLLTSFTDIDFNLILLMSTITTMNFVFYADGYIGFIIITYYTAIIIDYFYKKAQCTDINLKYIPKKYFIYYIIAFLITSIILALTYHFPTFFHIYIIIFLPNIIIFLPNIVFIILMILVIKNYIPKDKDKDKKENIDTVA